MRVVEFIMGGIEKDPGGGVRKLSEDIMGVACCAVFAT